MALLRYVFAIGPLLFGLGFLAPLVTQSLQALGWSAPLGLTPLAFGLVLGGSLGLVANIRGRWV